MKKKFRSGNGKRSRYNVIAVIVCSVLCCSLLASIFTMALGFMTDNFTKDDPSSW